MPYHLLRARRLKELFEICLFNFEFLQAKVYFQFTNNFFNFKLCSFPLQLVVADYEDAIAKIEDQDICRQLGLVVDALRLSASLLSRYPYMLAFELLGNFIKFLINLSRLLVIIILMTNICRLQYFYS